jgi:creatinine amidohydrolase
MTALQTWFAILASVPLVLGTPAIAQVAAAQTNPLWREEKVKNFLPHMTSPEVRDLLRKTDMAIIPVASLEQHGLHAPIGSDFYSGLERAKLIAQRTDILVVPILFPGQSPYHMEFPGTITLSAETLERVYFEAAQSLIHHGFRRLIFLNAHGGNQFVTKFLVDRINQETPAVAIDLGEGIASLSPRPAGNMPPRNPAAPTPPFDQHGGVGETSGGLYLYPSLIALEKAETATLSVPSALNQLFQRTREGDATATLVFMAEALKPTVTGKRTTTADLSTTGAWSERNPRDATAEQGRRSTESFVDAAVRFIDRWKELRANHSSRAP